MQQLKTELSETVKKRFIKKLRISYKQCPTQCSNMKEKCNSENREWWNCDMLKNEVKEKIDKPILEKAQNRWKKYC